MAEPKKYSGDGDYLNKLSSAFTKNPLLFQQTKTMLESLIVETNGAPSFDNQFVNALSLMNKMANETVFPASLYMQLYHGNAPSLEAFDKTFVSELTAFSKFIWPILKNTLDERRATDRQAMVALKVFK